MFHLLNGSEISFYSELKFRPASKSIGPVFKNILSVAKALIEG